MNDEQVKVITCNCSLIQVSILSGIYAACIMRSQVVSSSIQHKM